MSTSGSPLEALKGGFRRACVKRLVSDENGAIEVLKNEIPLLVVAWAKTSSLEPAEKKAKLKEMFDDESARAEELAVAFDLFAARFEARVASRVEESVDGVVGRMEKLSEKLEKTLSELAAARLPAQEELEAQEISEENSPIFEEDEEIVVEGEEIPVEGEEEVEELNLDPPAGIGLKFDEIEEMIDELLSSEK
jgi:predicted RNA-binding protein with PUA domain